mmetsp:Transcript_17189/g.25951  ORF Transcript_17189/g.25951 Transcript_17189/m.25951 type:complete len:380 (-) Transcript_17189:134-1273(-)
MTRAVINVLALLGIAASTLAEDSIDLPSSLALDADDECVSDSQEDCALQALQLRASRATVAATPAAEEEPAASDVEESDEGAESAEEDPDVAASSGEDEDDPSPSTFNETDYKVVDDLPEGWNETDKADEDKAVADIATVIGQAAAGAAADVAQGGAASPQDAVVSIGKATTDVAASIVGQAVNDATHGGLKPMYDHYVAVNCKYNPGAKQCAIYRGCQGPRYCVMGGYMIVPGFYCAGMESVNSGDAASLDYLWDAAKRMCGHTHCVLLTNPVGYRTQNQMHIHYRYYNDGGSHMKAQLERTLCDRSPGWHYFNKCGAGKARLYDYFPGVFSEVARAYGGGPLSYVGISVWFTTACGGFKTIVLATTHCSIEHDVSSR